MEKRKKTILLALLLLASCATIVYVLGTAISVSQAGENVHNAGSVKKIGTGVYTDPMCTNQTSSINWGLLDPGSTKIVKVYIRNEGNTAATLSKTLGSWTPSETSKYISLNWNYSGQILSANQVIPVSLTLTVSSAISGITSFGFDLTVTARD